MTILDTSNQFGQIKDTHGVSNVINDTFFSVVTSPCDIGCANFIFYIPWCSFNSVSVAVHC